MALVRLLTGAIVATGCATIPWLAWRAGRRALSAIGALALAVMVIGAIVGLALYPLSDAIVLAFVLPGGFLLGRALPPRFRPFLVFLVILSALDLVQVALTSGPAPGPSAPSTGLNPHLIWVNFRIGLPGGHFNIGFVDLLLITAMGEHFRRRDRSVAIGLLPGVFGIVLAELVADLVGNNPTFALATLSQALIPYLTVGYLLANALAVNPLGARRADSVVRLSATSPADDKDGRGQKESQQHHGGRPV